MGCAYKAAVLIVDDDAELRALTAEMLAVEGYRTMEADGASEAIFVLSKQDVDVLLTDVRMPGLSGILLAQQAKRIQPKLHVIFTTGAISLRQSDAQRHGTFLFKPYHARQLDFTITKALGEAR
jgi:DNA-binding NtrC family response regulator